MHRQSARQRITYIIPHHDEDRLSNSTVGKPIKNHLDGSHNIGHLLGINALALHVVPINASSSTASSGSDQNQLHSRLYTAGRDGAVAAWDLGLDMDVTCDPASQLEEDERPWYKLPGSNVHWRVGLSEKQPRLRHLSRHHTDWVNDLAVCLNGRLVVSASSDCTVKLWQPEQDPYGRHIQTIGIHKDYARVLAYPRHVNWIASGGLDRKVCLWDLGETRNGQQPITTYQETTDASSVYALACDPEGKLLMYGSPDKMIRVLDPRTGQRVKVLAGHNELVRAILISEDQRTALSASSDATIKLWSLTAGRCIATYNSYDGASVWSLFSEDPQLRCFHSGTRDGLVTKHWLNDDDSEDCVVPVLRESAGVCRMVGLHDTYLWTAVANTNITRWRDVTFSEAQSLLPSESEDESFEMSEHNTAFILDQPMDESKLLDNATVLDSVEQYADETSSIRSLYPLREAPDVVVQGKRGLIKAHILNDRRYVLTKNTAGEIQLWDIIYCTCIKSFGVGDFQKILEELNPEIYIPAWCTVDTRIGLLAVSLDERHCFDAEVYADESHLEEGALSKDASEEQRINLGKWVLRGLFSEFTKHILEQIQRGTQDGQQQTTVDDGHLRANELEEERSTDLQTAHSSDQSTENLTGSSSDSDAEETDDERASDTATSTVPIVSPSPMHPSSPPMFGALFDEHSPAFPNASTVALPPSPPAQDTESDAPQAPTPSTLSMVTTPRPSPQIYGQGQQPTFAGETNSNDSSDQSTSAHTDKTSTTRPRPTLLRRLTSFSSKRPQSRQSSLLSASSTSTTPAPLAEEQETKRQSLTTTSTQRTLVENERSVSKQPTTKAITDSASSTVSSRSTSLDPRKHESRTPSQPSNTGQHKKLVPVSRRPQPDRIVPPGPDTPLLTLPRDVTIVISETFQQMNGSIDLYRSTLSDVVNNIEEIEAVLPDWVLSFLYYNNIPQKDVHRINFILRPYPGSGLKALSDGSTPVRLSASRMLRVRKILAYILDRLEVHGQEKDTAGTSGNARPSSIYSSVSNKQESNATASQSRLCPEEWLEVLCQDKVLSPTTTLGTIRAFIWKSSSDIVIFYRERVKPLPSV